MSIRTPAFMLRPCCLAVHSLPQVCVHIEEWSQPEPPLFAPTPGHPSMGPMQRVTPPRGMASVGPQVSGGDPGGLQGLSPRGL